MAIPTIPGTSRVQTQDINIRRSAQPQIQRLEATKQAFKAGAEGLSDVVGAIALYEQKKAKAEEQAAFNEASIKMRKTTSAFRDTLRKNPNDTEWVKNWTELSAQTREEVLADKRFIGEGRKKMVLELNTWQGDTTAEFTTAADIAGSERRKRIGMLAADAALKDGNEPAASAAIDGLVDAGDMWKEDAEQLKMTFGAQIQENQIRVGMMADPQATLKDIDSGMFSKVPKSAMTSLRRQVQVEIGRQQGQTRDDLLMRLDSGDIIDETEIAAKEKAKEISPQGAKSLRAYIQRKEWGEAKDAHSLLMMRVDDHTWLEDKEPEKFAQEIRDEGAALPSSLRKSLYERVNSKISAIKKNESTAERPVESNALQMAKDYFRDGLFVPPIQEEVGSLWWKKMQTRELTPDEAKDWEKMVPRETADQARLNYARYLTKMRQFFRDTPNATDEQAAEFSQKLIRPIVMEQVSASLKNSEPPANVTEQEYAKLKPGQTYYWNGQILTKK